MLFALAVARIGEAANPGPAAGVSYADPAKQAFRGARLAEGREHRSGCTADAPPSEEPWALSATTANTTGWGPLERLLQSTTADVILAQEHRLRGAQMAEASEWVWKKGWKSIWAEANKTPEGGLSGGVAVFARQHLGLTKPP